MKKVEVRSKLEEILSLLWFYCSVLDSNKLSKFSSYIQQLSYLYSGAIYFCYWEIYYKMQNGNKFKKNELNIMPNLLASISGSTMKQLLVNDFISKLMSFGINKYKIENIVSLIFDEKN